MPESPESITADLQSINADLEAITADSPPITVDSPPMTTAPASITAGAVLYQRQGLTIAAMLMAVALVLSIAGNLYQLWLSGAVHYVTVGTGKRLSRPGEIPPQALRDMATSFVQLVGNGTPAGLAENWADAERYMTSTAREAFIRVKAEQFPMIEAGQISITTEALKVTGIHTLPQGAYNLYKVNLKGQQTVRYGAMSMGALAAEFSVTLLAGNKGLSMACGSPIFTGHPCRSRRGWCRSAKGQPCGI